MARGRGSIGEGATTTASAGRAATSATTPSATTVCSMAATATGRVTGTATARTTRPGTAGRATGTGPITTDMEGSTPAGTRSPTESGAESGGRRRAAASGVGRVDLLSDRGVLVPAAVLDPRCVDRRPGRLLPRGEVAERPPVAGRVRGARLAVGSGEARHRHGLLPEPGAVQRPVGDALGHARRHG